MNIDKKLVLRVGAVGLGAVGVGLLVKWWLGRTVDESASKAPEMPTGPALDLFTSDYTARQQRAFADALPERAKKYAPMLLESGLKYGVSPLVLAGIMHTETRYGAACYTNACQGSTGHDFGIMQINDIHKEFFRRKVNGRPAYEDPYASIMYAGAVLRDNIRQMAQRNKTGRVAVSKDRAKKYGCPASGLLRDARPISGMQQLRAAVAGYNAGGGNAVIALACGLDPEVATAGKRYVASVLGEANRLLGLMPLGNLS